MVGITQATYIFSDSSGNEARCSFSITVLSVDSDAPIVSGCPNSASYPVPFGTQSRVVTWIEPTAFDNSGRQPTVVRSHQPGQNFPVGRTPVTYIFTDSSGNEAQCSFSITVIVVDTIPPVISGCPQSPTYTVPLGTSGRVASWIEPIATDDSGVTPTYIQSHSPGDRFMVGVTQVTYIFSDSSRNEARCSFGITVLSVDSDAPIVSGCPNSASYPVPFGTQSRVVTWIEPTAVDNSGIQPTVVRSHQPGQNFPVGRTPVTYIFTDSSGNEAQCSFSITVIVVDTIPPVISGCPQSPTYTVPLGTSGRVASWIEPTATDDSGITPTYIQSHSPGDRFMVGITQATYIFSDSSGNEAHCSFSITVLSVDSDAPIVSGCPNSASYPVPFGTQSRVVTWIEPTAVDNSGIQPTVVRSHQPGQNFPVGRTPVTYIFTDSSGNEAQCSFSITVIVVDTIPPVISGCPLSPTYTVPLGTSGRVASWIEPTATDDSGITPTYIQSHSPGDRFMVGITRVTYIFSDSSGNEARCSFGITVLSVDSDAPIVSGCPNSARYPVPFGTSSLPVTWVEPTASDNSGRQPTISRTHQPGQAFPVGTTPVTYTFTDSSGNEAQCSFTITVNVVDTIPPVINGCPRSPTYTVPLGTSGRIVSWIEPTATDDSGVTPTYIQTHSPGDYFMVGMTQVSYIFTDQAANQETCSFAVTVLSVDSDAPIVSGCPNSARYPVPFGTSSLPVTWVEPTAFDNSGRQPTISRTHQPGQAFPVGTSPVTYTFTDSSGNEAQCSFFITVNVVDTIPPVISGCPLPATYTVPLGTLGRVASWIEPTATDDSGVTPTYIQSHRPGDRFMVGLTRVTYIFTDQAENQETCSFSITVLSVDSDAPIVSGCPNSARYPVPFGTSSRPVTWVEPTAFDNSGSQPTISRTHRPGQAFPVGTTPVTYTFTDSSGNEAQCSFTITVNVVDTIPPVISGCPLPARYTVQLGTLGRVASWIEPTATDDSGVTPTYIQSHRPGDSFMVGVTRVTYIFEDAAGNQETCSFGITVLSIDSDAPIVSGCPNSAIYPVPSGTQSRSVTWIEPTAFDNSGAQPTVTRSHQPGQAFPVGTTTVTYTFTDSSGNQAQCSFTVTVNVVDTIPPVISGCPRSATYTVPLGTSRRIVSWTEPTATDDSGVTPTFMQSHRPGDSFMVGITQVSYTFTDQSGNQEMCLFTITVLSVDSDAPIVSGCPNSAIYPVPFGTSSRSVTWIEPTAFDNSGEQPTVTRSHLPGQTFPVGTTSVTYTFTDSSGNQAQCSFSINVNVVDTIPPVIRGCPQPVTATVAFGTPSTQVSWIPPTATDDSGAVPTCTSTHNPGDTFPVGVAQVTTVCSDASRNQATCSFTVTVVAVDNTPPVIRNCPQSATYTVPLGTLRLPVNWVEPTYFDESTVNILQSHRPGDNFPVGFTEVIYIFTDSAGNEAFCRFDVTVISIDTTPPTIMGCPQSATYTVELGTPSRTVTWTEPMATDNAGGQPSVVRSHQPGSTFPVGTTQVSYTFTDQSQNTATCSFAVIVNAVDTIAPVISQCPRSVSYSIPLGTISRIATWTEPTATDNSGQQPSLLQSHRPGDLFLLGSTQVCYIFSDGANNQERCCFMITVIAIDTDAPIISGCPGSASYPVAFGTPSRSVTWIEPTAFDNSGGEPNVVKSHEPGQIFFVGTTQVTYTFTDNSANQAQCSFTVTVAIVDSIPPVVRNCPQPIFSTVPLGTPTQIITWIEPTATDDSGVEPTVMQSHRPGESFMIGVSQVSYTFSDSSGNQATCSFAITVTPVDTIAPIINGCPDSATYSVSFGVSSRIVTWIEPTAIDNSGGQPTVTQTHQPRQSFPVGITPVTYTFTDSSQNQARCSFTITVNQVDNSPPVIIGCPRSTSYTIPLGTTSRIVSWIPPTANDDSGVVPTCTGSHNPGQSFPIGITQVMYGCTDLAGNQATCTFAITVEAVDFDPPVITNCPESSMYSVPIGTSSRIVSWIEPIAVDNSGGQPLVSQSHQSGQSFPVGSSQVEYRFTDNAGNTATCAFVITVSTVDSNPPVVVSCPQPIMRSTSVSGSGCLPVNWIPPTATDDSGFPPELLQSHRPGDEFCVGVEQVQYQFSDGAGNVARCSFTVTVSATDNVPPVVTFCPPSQTFNTLPGAGGISVTWQEPQAVDNSGITPTVTQTHNSGNFFSVGNTNVIYIFTDNAGNQARCEFFVTVTATVVDVIPPVISGCVNDFSVELPAGNTQGIVTWPEPTATDNSGVQPSVSRSHIPMSLFSLGRTNVIYRFTDQAGNMATCSFLVTVTVQMPDRIPPTITGCPRDMEYTVNVAPGQIPSQQVSWTEPTATDNSGMAPSVLQTHLPGDEFIVGSTTVIYIFSDQAGNQARCEFVVNIIAGVIDTAPPVISGCPVAPVIITAPMGSSGEIVSWNPITATDNDGVQPFLTQSHQSGSFFAVGETSVRYTFTDQSGNSAFCTFIVNVRVATDVNPPIVQNCPEPLTYTVPSGDIFLSVSWIPPTAFDAEGPVDLLQTHRPGDTFVLGTTTVQYIFTDQAGNRASCIFTVTIEEGQTDTIPPVVTRCPEDIRAELPAGSTSGSVTWPEPQATDNSGVTPTLVCSHQPFTQFPVGTTRVVCTFTDPSSNTAICAFDVIIEVVADDRIPPVINNCPNDETYTLPAGQSGRAVTWLEPTATDNDGTQPTKSQTHLPGETFFPGSSPVSYQFTDRSGNTAVCTFTITITVADTTPPNVFGCPGPIRVSAPFGDPTAAVEWVEPTATDESGFVQQTLQTHRPGDVFSAGVTTVRYQFEDGSGNRAECMFDVTVTTGVDTTPPDIISCPPDTTLVPPAGVIEIAVWWIEPTATDPSEPVMVSQTHRPLDLFPAGMSNVVYRFTDAAGNTDTCEFTITVIAQDTLSPVVSDCPRDIIRTVPTTSTGTTVTWVEPTATDDSGIRPDVMKSHTPGLFFSVGATLVTYTFSDLSGNEAVCSFNVIVRAGVDNIPPVVDNCPNDIVEFAGVGANFAVVEWVEPTATDNSGAALTITRTHESREQFPLGNTQVTYTFTDPSGNTAFCDFDVIVLPFQDDEPPVVQNCPNDIRITALPGTTIATATWTEPTAIDNDNMLPSRVRSHVPGSTFSVGQTRVTYTFTDSSGNQAVCSFFVFVSPATDNVRPVISGCPNDIEVQAPAGSTSTPVGWTEPTATDNSGVEPTVVRTRVPGSSFNVGTTLVRYTFSDQAGNTASCTFNVIVTTSGPVDMTPPNIFNCRANPVQVTASSSSNFATAFWTEPTATDDSGVPPMRSRSHAPGSSFPVGTTTVTYRFTDGAGNSAVCVFDVIVSRAGDNIPPVISGCPTSDVRVLAPTGSNFAMASWTEPTATDNSGVPPTRTRSHTPGSFFAVGVTTVTYTFTDGSGNSDICTFEVIVSADDVDRTPPVVSNCPTSFSVTTEPGETAAFVDWTEPSATDDSGTVDTSSTHTPPRIFPPGAATVIYTFTDPSGNSDVCTFVVTVIPNNVDRTPPVVRNCPTSFSVTTEPGETAAFVDWPEPSATDNSGTVFTSSTHTPPRIFPPGSTTVTYTFTDPSGNSDTCNFVVTVILSDDDTTPPVITGCPRNTISVSAPAGSNTATAFWTEPTATDDSGNTPTRSRTHAPGSLFPIGLTLVTYRFFDQAGNVATCQFQVVVNTADDTTPPIVTGCPNSAIRVTAPAGSNFATAVWTEPRATDDSGETPTTSRTHAPGSSFEIGTTRVIYRFFDTSGNVATCQFDVIVSRAGDSIPPVITGCPTSAIRVTATVGSNFATAFWTEPRATDNSGETPTRSRTHAPGSLFDIGTTGVTYRFFDASGNVATCQFDVIVSRAGDTIPPVITGCPNSAIRVTAPTSSNFATAFWTEPTATDNSGETPTRSRTHAPGSSFAVGTTGVTYRFFDASGNVATCQFDVIVSRAGDTIPPVITGCPTSAIRVTAPAGSNFATAFWTEPTATDNSGGTPTRSRTHAPGSSFAVGTTGVTYRFFDTSGNVATCQFDVIVSRAGDTIPPVITGCPTSAIRVTAPAGSNFGTAVWTEPTATDNSGETPTTSRTHAPGSSFAIGRTEVTYRFFDASGNIATCEFDVIVSPGGITDTTPPEISGCPDDITVRAPEGSNSRSVTWTEPTATDDSGVEPMRVRTRSPGDTFNVGSTIVAYTFTDGAGNIATCDFNVIVTPGGVVDVTPPTIMGCPSDIIQNMPSGNFARVEWDEPTATDDSGTATLEFQNYFPGSFFEVNRPIEIIYTFQDPSGNEATCTFTVSITRGTGGDTTPPVITGCPNTVRVSTPAGTNTATATWIEPRATDDSGSTPIRSRSHTPGSEFALGVTTVTYIFTDGSGNMETCTFDVVVSIVPTNDTDPPIIISCPEDFNVTAPEGSNSTEVAWEEPIAFDESGGIPTVQKTHEPGSRFDVGVTSVSYTFSDSSENMAVCNFNVEVLPSGVDNIPPVITGCPNTVRVSAPAGTNTAIATWTEPRATDNSGDTPTRTRTHTPGSSFPIGRTVVTYRFFDASANIATCQFDVIITSSGVVDNIPPVITGCPNTVRVSAPAGSTSAIATWTEPRATDNSGDTPTRSRTHTPGSPFPIGTTAVTYRFFDASANIATCQFNVIVTSSGGGGNIIVSNCPGDLNMIAPQGSSFYQADWEEPSAIDTNGGVVSVMASHTPPRFFTVPSENEITYTFSNNAGDEAVCMFTVSVSTGNGADITPPEVRNCPESFEVQTQPGETAATASWTEPTATDVSTPVTSTRSHSPGQIFPPGMTVVTYEFFDAVRNRNTCTFIITVATSDTSRPVVTGCPSSFIVNIESGNTAAVVEWVEPTATDNSGTVFTTSTHTPPTILPPGSTSITYTFTDPVGNQNTCTFIVTVISSGGGDTTAPVISGCPVNAIRVNALLGAACEFASWTEPTAIDNSGVTPTRTRTHVPGDCFDIGSTTVTYTFTDGSSNSARCQFQVVVTATGGDTIPPVITGCPSSAIRVTAPTGSNTATAVWTEPSATDNSGSTPTRSRSHAPGSLFPVGITRVTYRFFDASGNVATCGFDVIVSQSGTGGGITITGCPNDIRVSAPQGTSFYQAEWEEPTAVDDRGVPVTADASHTPPRFLNVPSTTEITYTFSNAAGTTEVCRFSYIITTDGGGVDTTPPVVSNCPADITRIITPPSTSTQVTWTPPTATDDSGITPTRFSSHDPGNTFSQGITFVTYTFMDAAGNEATPCVFSVTVQVGSGDTTPPVVTFCPDNIIREVPPGTTGTIVTWREPIATDNSGVDPVVTRTHVSGTRFTIGTDRVTYTFTDGSSNRNTCSFMVTVREFTIVDTEPPRVTCPADITRNCVGRGSTSTSVTWDENSIIATDNSGIVSFLSSSHFSGSSFNPGVTVVTYEYVDPSNNVGSCSFRITVGIDTVPPRITNCPDDILSTAIRNGENVQVATVSWTEPTAVDDCGGQIVQTSTHRPGQEFPVGTTNVIYRFTDVNGNIASCIFTVVVTAPGAPTVTNCPSDINENLGAGPSQRVTWTEPTGRDNRGTTIVPSQTHRPGSNFPIGVTTVTYTFTAGGQEARCTFTVTIRDVTPPTIRNCTTTTITRALPMEGMGSTVSWNEPFATDNSGLPVEKTQTHTMDFFFTLGEHRVIYNFTDSFGNWATCEFRVVISKQPPNPCMSNPCPSPTMCYYTESTYICLPDNQGGRKRRDIEDVESMFEELPLLPDEGQYCPCENGGTCMKDPWNGGGNYCKCPAGYSGILCENVGDETTVKVEYGVELVGAIDKLQDMYKQLSQFQSAMVIFITELFLVILILLLVAYCVNNRRHTRVVSQLAKAVNAEKAGVPHLEKANKPLL
ncbi:uncharacterized protein [Amphiura filiformis]|uniref:uncharacterized protein n=1 Tax=Amphiura filiformis TaxID=82378 RepID=UPI003B2188D9